MNRNKENSSINKKHTIQTDLVRVSTCKLRHRQVNLIWNLVHPKKNKKKGKKQIIMIYHILVYILGSCMSMKIERGLSTCYFESPWDTKSLINFQSKR